MDSLPLPPHNAAHLAPPSEFDKLEVHEDFLKNTRDLPAIHQFLVPCRLIDDQTPQTAKIPSELHATWQRNKQTLTSLLLTRKRIDREQRLLLSHQSAAGDYYALKDPGEYRLDSGQWRDLFNPDLCVIRTHEKLAPRSQEHTALLTKVRVMLSSDSASIHQQLGYFEVFDRGDMVGKGVRTMRDIPADTLFPASYAGVYTVETAEDEYDEQQLAYQHYDRSLKRVLSGELSSCSAAVSPTNANSSSSAAGRGAGAGAGAGSSSFAPSGAASSKVVGCLDYSYADNDKCREAKLAFTNYDFSLSTIKGPEGEVFLISAARLRGVTCIFNDATGGIEDVVTGQPAVNNMEVFEILLGGVLPTLFFHLVSPVPKGRELFFSYGKVYWKLFFESAKRLVSHKADIRRAITNNRLAVRDYVNSVRAKERAQLDAYNAKAAQLAALEAEMAELEVAVQRREVRSNLVAEGEQAAQAAMQRLAEREAQWADAVAAEQHRSAVNSAYLAQQQDQLDAVERSLDALQGQLRSLHVKISQAGGADAKARVECPACGSTMSNSSTIGKHRKTCAGYLRMVQDLRVVECGTHLCHPYVPGQPRDPSCYDPTYHSNWKLADEKFKNGNFKPAASPTSFAAAAASAGPSGGGGGGGGGGSSGRDRGSSSWGSAGTSRSSGWESYHDRGHGGEGYGDHTGRHKGSHWEESRRSNSSGYQHHSGGNFGGDVSSSAAALAEDADYYPSHGGHKRHAAEREEQRYGGGYAQQEDHRSSSKGAAATAGCGSNSSSAASKRKRLFHAPLLSGSTPGAAGRDEDNNDEEEEEDIFQEAGRAQYVAAAQNSYVQQHAAEAQLSLPFLTASSAQGQQRPHSTAPPAAGYSPSSSSGSSSGSVGKPPPPSQASLMQSAPREQQSSAPAAVPNGYGYPYSTFSSVTSSAAASHPPNDFRRGRSDSAVTTSSSGGAIAVEYNELLRQQPQALPPIQPMPRYDHALEESRRYGANYGAPAAALSSLHQPAYTAVPAAAGAQQMPQPSPSQAYGLDGSLLATRSYFASSSSSSASASASAAATSFGNAASSAHGGNEAMPLFSFEKRAAK